ACTPLQGIEAALEAGSEIARLAACDRDGPDVASNLSLVTHQSADEQYALAVRSDQRIVHLERRCNESPCGPSGKIHELEPGDVPLVVGVADGIGHREPLAVRRPIVLIDVAVGGRNQPEFTR